MPTAINLKARETQARLARHKKVVLPTKHDIETFLNFINRERRCNYTELLENYSHSSFKYGIELCAIYLMVFNRRRVGDVQNILIEDYNHCEGIDEKTDKDIYNSLCDEDKGLAKKYQRFLIRGKKGRTVSVILTPKIIDHIDLLLKYREISGIPASNGFLFALPKFREPYINCTVDLCIVMKKLTGASGAINSVTLRGTQLRKQIATMCVELDLSEDGYEDLANHLGHDKKTHRDIYR